MSWFNEDELERATLEWFEELEYEIAHGPDLAPEGSDPERPDYQTVVLEDRLYNALTTINPHANPEQIEEAIRQVMTAKHPNLLMNNRDFHRFLTDGIDVTTTKAGEEERTEKLWLLDPDQIENNDFLALNQYTVIEGWNNKRPDVVVFVNGLPVVVFELKNSSDEN